MRPRRLATILTVAAAMALATGCGAGTNSGNGQPNAKLPNPPNGALPGPAALTTASPLRSFATETDPSRDPRSTFALDIDTASYSYTRAQINQGRRPDPADIRPEEFINSFNGGYTQPDSDGFAVALDGARLPAGHELPADYRLLRVGLQTRAESGEPRGPAVLTFVIDVSGSMAEQAKLRLVKDSMYALIDRLTAADSVAIVTFNEVAHQVLPLTPADRKSALHEAIDALTPGGTTNLDAGLSTGYRTARAGFRAGATNRVILLSDGLANTGDTSATTILAKVAEEAGKQITLLGVGVGLDYGDQLMEQLADRGDGFVIYINDSTQARQQFISRLPATTVLRALDAKAQVTFSPDTVAAYRLIGYDNRALADSSFRNDHVDGGEVVAGRSVTAVYAVRLRPDATGLVALAEVRWLDPTTRQPNEASDQIFTTDLAVDFNDASPRLAVCYVAAYLAEVLRNSPYGSQVRLPNLAQIAAAAAERTQDQAVADLAETIRQAQRLR